MIHLSEHDAARLGLADAKPRRKASHAREARPDVPRAARAGKGEGDRVPDLMRLAAAGYTCTHFDAASGLHWMSGAAGETPRVPSYRQMLDDTLRTL